MSTSTPIICTTAFSLIYDGTASGAFSGSVQATGGVAIFNFTATSPAPTDGGFISHPESTPITISATDKLYARALNGVVSVTYSNNVNPPGTAGGGSSIDRELVVSTYLAINAFTGASAGDTITSTQVIDVTGTPVTVSVIWRNQTTAADLAGAPSAADLELTGSEALTNAQFRARTRLTAALTAETGAFTILAGAVGWSVTNVGAAPGVLMGAAFPVGASLSKDPVVGLDWDVITGDATSTTFLVGRDA